MRRTNWRVTIVGGVLALMAIAFFVFMLTMMPKSNDPAEMMRTVGRVSGAVGGIGIIMSVFGFIGTKK